ncbi:hypothetical protein [Gynuella sunshinyii]|uniref:hypothetical protein n=1 Tax=Gynuella sunshinyii TaxID=1445505 RepID=UPI0005CC2FB2|nr:hypothetical protein [Gynuella sunshinyii]
MEPLLPTDEDTNLFFDDVIIRLVSDLGYSKVRANEITHEFYSKFTDKEYCDSLGIGLHDDDLFFHDGVGGVALKIYYYLDLKGDPDPVKFKQWRASRYRS